MSISSHRKLPTSTHPEAEAAILAIATRFEEDERACIAGVIIAVEAREG